MYNFKVRRNPTNKLLRAMTTVIYIIYDGDGGGVAAAE